MSQAFKDFARGMGQALDLGGTMAQVRHPRVSKRQSDTAALRSDWEAVGGYMQKAMDRVRQESN